MGAQPTLTLEGPGFALAASARQPSADTHERTFGFFSTATPGASGSVRASVGSRTYGAAGAYSLALPVAAALEAQTRTASLYVDRSSLRVAYQLRSALGESRVLQSQLSVSARLRFGGDGVADYVVSCSRPAVASGIGECASTLPSSAFGGATRTAAVEVSAQYGSGTAIAAAASDVTLQAAVSHSSLSSVGMLASLPQSPRYVGDEFDVSVYAHSGPANFALIGWSLSLQYDTGVLSMVQQQFSAVYQAPTFAIDGAAGTFDVVTTGISATQTNTDVQGQTALYLMTLSFRVVGGASAAVRRVLNGTVGAMVNQGTQRYLTDAVLSVTDLRAGRQSEGTLAVEAVQGVGVFAYS